MVDPLTEAADRAAGITCSSILVQPGYNNIGHGAGGASWLIFFRYMLTLSLGVSI